MYKFFIEFIEKFLIENDHRLDDDNDIKITNLILDISRLIIICYDEVIKNPYYKQKYNYHKYFYIVTSRQELKKIIDCRNILNLKFKGLDDQYWLPSSKDRNHLIDLDERYYNPSSLSDEEYQKKIVFFINEVLKISKFPDPKIENDCYVVPNWLINYDENDINNEKYLISFINWLIFKLILNEDILSKKYQNIMHSVRSKRCMINDCNLKFKQYQMFYTESNEIKEKFKGVTFCADIFKKINNKISVEHKKTILKFFNINILSENSDSNRSSLINYIILNKNDINFNILKFIYKKLLLITSREDNLTELLDNDLILHLNEIDKIWLGNNCINDIMWSNDSKKIFQNSKFYLCESYDDDEELKNFFIEKIKISEFAKLEWLILKLINSDSLTIYNVYEYLYDKFKKADIDFSKQDFKSELEQKKIIYLQSQNSQACMVSLNAVCYKNFEFYFKSDLIYLSNYDFYNEKQQNNNKARFLFENELNIDKTEDIVKKIFIKYKLNNSDKNALNRLAQTEKILKVKANIYAFLSRQFQDNKINDRNLLEILANNSFVFYEFHNKNQKYWYSLDNFIDNEKYLEPYFRSILADDEHIDEKIKEIKYLACNILKIKENAGIDEIIETLKKYKKQIISEEIYNKYLKLYKVVKDDIDGSEEKLEKIKKYKNYFDQDSILIKSNEILYEWKSRKDFINNKDLEIKYGFHDYSKFEGLDHLIILFDNDINYESLLYKLQLISNKCNELLLTNEITVLVNIYDKLNEIFNSLSTTINDKNIIKNSFSIKPLIYTNNSTKLFAINKDVIWNYFQDKICLSEVKEYQHLKSFFIDKLEVLQSADADSIIEQLEICRDRSKAEQYYILLNNCKLNFNQIDKIKNLIIIQNGEKVTYKDVVWTENDGYKELFICLENIYNGELYSFFIEKLNVKLKPHFEYAIELLIKFSENKTSDRSKILKLYKFLNSELSNNKKLNFESEFKSFKNYYQSKILNKNIIFYNDNWYLPKEVYITNDGIYSYLNELIFLSKNPDYNDLKSIFQFLGCKLNPKISYYIKVLNILIDKNTLKNEKLNSDDIKFIEVIYSKICLHKSKIKEEIQPLTLPSKLLSSDQNFYDVNDLYYFDIDELVENTTLPYQLWIPEHFNISKIEEFISIFEIKKVSQVVEFTKQLEQQLNDKKKISNFIVLTFGFKYSLLCYLMNEIKFIGNDDNKYKTIIKNFSPIFDAQEFLVDNLTNSYNISNGKITGNIDLSFYISDFFDSTENKICNLYIKKDYYCKNLICKKDKLKIVQKLNKAIRSILNKMKTTIDKFSDELLETLLSLSDEDAYETTSSKKWNISENFKNEFETKYKNQIQKPPQDNGTVITTLSDTPNGQNGLPGEVPSPPVVDPPSTPEKTSTSGITKESPKAKEPGIDMFKPQKFDPLEGIDVKEIDDLSAENVLKQIMEKSQADPLEKSKGKTKPNNKKPVFKPDFKEVNRDNLKNLKENREFTNLNRQITQLHKKSKLRSEINKLEHEIYSLSEKYSNEWLKKMILVEYYQH
ncbi:MAG: hypothetical protein GYA62_15690 [Bacteroidales bacterium]|nr:hypothetical protein [Bacteroidales bacterium]